MMINVNSSMISLIYVIALVAFFLVLVIITITLIASKSKDAEELDEEYEDDATEALEYDEEYNDDEAETEEIPEDSAFVNTLDVDDTDEEYVNTFDDAEEASYDVEVNTLEENSDESEDEESDVDEAESPLDMGDDEDTAKLPTITDDMLGNVDEETSDTFEGSTDVSDNDTSEASISEEQLSGESEDDMLIDSAFAPETVAPELTNEALNASVKEAMALGAALSQTGHLPVFGVAEALDNGTRRKSSGKAQSKSTVPSTDDFYWYNRVDVAEKPSYKTAEMYYHYFNIPKDCIEDLLIEMYDCALVRTEEIRYIAYGIEPRAVSMKEILTSGNHNYIQQKKRKEPSPQDMVKIYEKWCSYVDKLFDVVEIHADSFTMDEIRNMLYEFGRNDVDVLIEGM